MITKRECALYILLYEEKGQRVQRPLSKVIKALITGHRVNCQMAPWHLSKGTKEVVKGHQGSCQRAPKKLSKDAKAIIKGHWSRFVQ